MLSNDYSYDNQCSIFDFLGTDDNNEIQINKDIYLIEMFAGYGSQALGFKRLNVPIKHHFVCEFDKYAVNSYNSIHGTSFPVSDIRDVKGGDLGITNTDKRMYMLTYSFP